ncbi:MAG: serine/threonine-protein kinase [Thermoguttaceae bacterium]
MAVTTPDEFFAVLEKSKLLTPSQLAQARTLVHEGGTPTTIAKLLARRELITRWQAGQLLAGRSSFYLGKYRLIELLGRGGMGNVFLGQHVTMNRRVALKIISRRIRKDRASVDRFLAEARAVATLDHENIVQAYSVDNEGERYYMVMEYVEGLDLQRLVEEDGPLDPRLAVEYIRQAAEGLDHAHRRGMIHCDIKPSNLLVNIQGVVKILDMGLARLTKGDPESSDPGVRVLGSVDYLAPEQAIEGPDFDHRADIYSLGCTLYFLLAGHAPFPEGSLAERIVKHQTQEPQDIRQQRPDIPPELAAICAKMMAKRPTDRHQSAAEVIAALTEWRTVASLKRAVPLVTAQSLDESHGLERRSTTADATPDTAGADRPVGRPVRNLLDVSPATGLLAPARPSLGQAVSRLFATPRRAFFTIFFVLLALAIVAIAVLSHGGNGRTHAPAPQGVKADTTSQSPEPRSPRLPPPLDRPPEPGEPH